MTNRTARAATMTPRIFSSFFMGSLRNELESTRIQLVHHGEGLQESGDIEHIADGTADASKNQPAAAGVNAFGNAEDGAEAVAAQKLEFPEIEDHALAAGVQEAAAMSLEQTRSGGVEAAFGGHHIGVFQLLVGELKHGDLLSPFHPYYPPEKAKAQPGRER